MANIAGYPSAVISGSPGKSGRIQQTVVVLFVSLTINNNDKRLTFAEKDQLGDFSANKQGTTSPPIAP